MNTCGRAGQRDNQPLEWTGPAERSLSFVSVVGAGPVIQRRSVMRQKHVANLAPQAAAREPLESLLKAGRFILDWSADVNEHRLWADKQKRAAVERQFEIIAEALTRLRKVDERTWHNIGDAATAVRLGETIRRDYDSIDYGILWRATRKELPEMLAAVEEAVAFLRR